MLNLNEIRVFLFAAEYGSFSAAARQLNLSQPAVSQKISNLESYFGLELFRREGRRVHLTEAGQILQPIAQELVASANRLEESMVSLNSDVIGEVQIGCSTISGRNLLPKVAAGFRQRFPQVRIHILISSHQALLDNLLSGDVALGVTSRRDDHRYLEYFHLFQDEIILIAPPDHSFSVSGHIYPKQLINQQFVLREQASGTRDVMARGLMGQQITLDMLNVVMVLENAEAIVMAVAEGVGIAFVSRLAAVNDLELGKVVEVAVDGLCLSREIYLARNRRIPATRAQDLFWEYAQSARQLFLLRTAGL